MLRAIDRSHNRRRSMGEAGAGIKSSKLEIEREGAIVTQAQGKEGGQ